MSDLVIKVENLAKQYRLGQVGRRTLSHDVNRWWHKIRGKEDPYLKIGQENERTKRSESEYVWALRDINFQVKKGEVLGIIGSNGAGKSTLLKILSKVTAPTEGQVKIKGRIASLLEVGTGFHQDLSGRENIFLNGAILGMTKKEIASKFDEIVDFAGVERYIDTPVKRYSSGMYVRLAFAVAAHLEPEILIIDEVLAVGDAEFQKKCLGKMKNVSENDGRTVLFVSHNMPALINLCTNAIVLKNGCKVFAGGTEECIDFYLNNTKWKADLNLSFSENRKGNGDITCSKVCFLDKQMSHLASAKSGDDINIEICYLVKKEAVHYVLFRLQIIGAHEEVLFTCNTEHTYGLIHTISKSGSVICNIPKLPLFGGSYNIHIQIYSRQSGLLDEIELYKALTVVDGDFFGTGKIPAVKKGLLVSHCWVLENEQ
jgi:lipopolysaccharide transport system ATP-binding protein